MEETKNSKTNAGVADRYDAEAEALVLACRRGEAEAWERLVNRYQRLLYSIPRRAGLNEELAAEVFQHVFTKLVEHLDRLEQPGRLQAWLVTIARRESLRLLQLERAAGVSLEHELEDNPALDPADSNPLAESVLETMQQQQLVYEAVQSLDERCRQLLTMLFYQSESPSYVEIAAALGTTEGSVGPTRARCLQKLQRELETVGF